MPRFGAGHNLPIGVSSRHRPRSVAQGVEHRDQFGRPLDERRTIASNCGVVTTCDGTGQRVRALVAQFSTVARIKGSRILRSAPVVRSTISAASSSVTRKFDAIDAAA